MLDSDMHVLINTAKDTGHFKRRAFTHTHGGHRQSLSKWEREVGRKQDGEWGNKSIGWPNS